MALLWGREYTKGELVRYAGSMAQLAGARRCELKDGRAEGVAAIDVRTGSGLDFTVLPDRAMDIAWAGYKGKPLCLVTKNGIVSSRYYEPEGDGWFRSYFAGLLTSCGLSNTGAACEDGGQRYGQHGRLSSTPAAQVNVSERWNGDEYEIELEGRMRESNFYGENLLLTRTIRTALGWKKLVLRDVVENQGFSEVPLFLLYHFNAGFPLLDAGSRLLLNAAQTSFYDEAAQAGRGEMLAFQKPTHDYFRQVFFHRLRQDAEGNTLVAVVNDRLEGGPLGLYLKFNRRQLPEFFEFKMMGEGDYQLGLEPSNCLPMGRAAERARGGLKMIRPWEPQEFRIEIGVLEGEQEVARTAAAIQSLVD